MATSQICFIIKLVLRQQLRLKLRISPKSRLCVFVSSKKKANTSVEMFEEEIPLWAVKSSNKKSNSEQFQPEIKHQGECEPFHVQAK